MKILFDTNIILDGILFRKPFANAAIELFSILEKKALQGYLAATTVTTIYYIARKAYEEKRIRKLIERLFLIFDVAENTKPDFEIALNSKIKDFEDAVLYQTAKRVGCDGIVTRNLKDFRTAKLPVYSPDHLLKKLNYH